MSDFTYVGSELDLFAAVHHWKSYWSSAIRSFVTGDVLEAGAGIGSNTAYLDNGHLKRFVCMEPDRRLIDELKKELRGKPRDYETVCGTLETVGAAEQFDTIVYIDVLEHIENDRAELERASAHLRPGGRIVVLSPAHQWLFTPFDAAIGHFRRYTRPMLRAISPPGVEMEACFYLDSVGLLASAANLLFLKQSMPSKQQLHFWDTYIVPISRVVDLCSRRCMGKSVVAVWRRNSIQRPT